MNQINPFLLRPYEACSSKMELFSVHLRKPTFVFSIYSFECKIGVTRTSGALRGMYKEFIKCTVHTQL